MHLPNNTRLHAGSYKIIRFINSGGFGCTYEAMHTLLNQRVAIKEFFVRDICNRDEMSGCVSVGTHAKEKDFARLKEKFVDEARALYQMQHQGLVHVTDVFEENGTAYYVMDYIEGQSLAQIVEKRRALPEAEALRYMREVCAALSYVHNRNRLHLDIKPGNIMVDSNERVVLIDFGASKHYNEATGEQTSTLLRINTPGYAPIEQMFCNFHKFSAATDIYSLGATFYKLLTGLTPPDTIGLLSGEEELKPLPGTISAPVRKAVEASMQLKRTDRPQTIDEFLDILSSRMENHTADVTVIGAESHSAHDAVDLGLSVNWATCNVGASSPEDYGDYFAWGKIKAKDEYTDENSETRVKSMGDISGNPKYDVACARWGQGWRMPTKSEIQELRANCTAKWTTYKGVKGCLVTSKKNGNYIFLPAAGGRGGTSLYNAGEYGSYWSSSPVEDRDFGACLLYFDSGFFDWLWGNRLLGRSVRPVRDR